MTRNIFRQPAVEIENIVRICNEKKIKARMQYLESFEKKVKDKEKSENNLEKKIKNNERTL